MVVSSPHQVTPDKWGIAPHVLQLETSIIREILKISSQPGVISFAGGLPAPELFPLADLKRMASHVVDKYGADSFQYSLSMGITPLRQLLAKRATERGTQSSIENILVTAGAQQGIELIARTFIDPGDYVLVENPTYVGALQAFNYYQARYVTVEMDDEGMIVEQVEAMLRDFRPKLIYTVSNFQNPTGITMSESRRRALVDAAIKYNVPIVDDNPYGEIRFSGERVPTLKSYGGDEVIALRSFSKVVSPGLRLGWINGPSSVMTQFEKVKQCTDLHTSSFGQYLIYEYVSQGLLEPQIERIKADYLAKRNCMTQAMEQHFPQEVTWTKPDGGLFLWVQLPESVSAKDLLPKAIAMKVAYVYGSPFFANGGGDNCLRLNFSNATLEQIVEGIKRLGKLLSENM
ncbi:MAG: PLP-dependent aminotransferase family protein [bacterium]|nr:PLP-dependent aminotransferase family protein [bacterium]